MSDTLTIKSHKGPYTATFSNESIATLSSSPTDKKHYFIDANIARLYSRDLGSFLNSSSVLIIEANENAKTLDKFTEYVEHLIAKKMRRGHSLVAIGGGVIQDIVCFLSATFLRGVDWSFIPTTLLAQADSCIGSKSSINVGSAKNILGTFTPPTNVIINPRFLNTLSKADIRSGVGEMLKVHAVNGPASFDRISNDYETLFTDPNVMLHYIRDSLEIKKRFIEDDEFDRGIRNVLNYGHSFGHAIESATNFEIPHGIAVTIGMDMAGFVSSALGNANDSIYMKMKQTFKKNYSGYEKTVIPTDLFLNAIAKDKKNTDTALTLILPDNTGVIRRHCVANDSKFHMMCKNYFSSEVLK